MMDWVLLYFGSEDAAISLNPKLEQWLQSSDVPVVYLSFGTLSTGIPELVSTIAQAAKKTSFRYVWSIPAKNTALLPEELKVSTETLESSQLPPPTAGSLWISGWQPQVAILSHTKVSELLKLVSFHGLKEYYDKNKFETGCRIFNSWRDEQYCRNIILTAPIDLRGNV